MPSLVVTTTKEVFWLVAIVPTEEVEAVVPLVGHRQWDTSLLDWAEKTAVSSLSRREKELVATVVARVLNRE